ncbi:hypothetical protein X975_25981, partial [Stegodyphus mimosarum]
MKAHQVVFKCSSCSKSFTRDGVLKQHEASHIRNFKKMFTSVLKKKYLLHIRVEHGLTRTLENEVMLTL